MMRLADSQDRLVQRRRISIRENTEEKKGDIHKIDFSEYGICKVRRGEEIRRRQICLVDRQVQRQVSKKLPPIRLVSFTSYEVIHEISPRNLIWDII